jgi:hypothetical protein
LGPLGPEKYVSKEWCSPNGGKDLLGEADIALAPYVVTVAVKARTRGEILTSRSQL